MFRGLATLTIDAKGRITIPRHYRTTIIQEAAGELVLTIDTEEECLQLYPRPQWLEVEQSLEQLPDNDPSARRLMRLLLGHAVEITLDRHGRFFLPHNLCDYAGLESNIVLIGQGRKFEIWGETQWHQGRDAWLAGDMDDNSGAIGEIMPMSL